MQPPAIQLLGNTNEAEKLRGFALSQLEILLNSMRFQELQQYTRLVRFSDGSYVKAFSSFGVNTITIFAPAAAVPERKIAEIKEDVFIIIEPCEINLEVPSANVSVGGGEWVLADLYDGSQRASSQYEPVADDEAWHSNNYTWIGTCYEASGTDGCNKADMNSMADVIVGKYKYGMLEDEGYVFRCANSAIAWSVGWGSLVWQAFKTFGLTSQQRTWPTTIPYPPYDPEDWPCPQSCNPLEDPPYPCTPEGCYPTWIRVFEWICE